VAALADGWVVMLANEPLTCSSTYGGLSPGKQVRVLFLEVADISLASTPPPVAPGTYAVVPSTGPTLGPDGTSTFASAEYGAGSADSCASTSETATGGTVTITTVSAAHVVGTYDLTFPDGSVQGSFDAPGCDASIFATDAGTNCGNSSGSSSGSDGGSGSGSSSGGDAGSGSDSGGGGVIAPPAGCSADSTVGCTGGATGFSCAAGSNPETENPSLSCSTPTTDSSGHDLYCCFAWSGSPTTCVADDSLSSFCAAAGGGDYGYKCVNGEDPSALDSSLACSFGSPDATDPSLNDFCCVRP
jgi:hypothetical protein